jgi:hypothetical protein
MASQKSIRQTVDFYKSLLRSAPPSERAFIKSRIAELEAGTKSPGAPAKGKAPPGVKRRVPAAKASRKAKPKPKTVKKGAGVGGARPGAGLGTGAAKKKAGVIACKVRVKGRCLSSKQFDGVLAVWRAVSKRGIFVSYKRVAEVLWEASRAQLLMYTSDRSGTPVYTAGGRGADAIREEAARLGLAVDPKSDVHQDAYSDVQNNVDVYLQEFGVKTVNYKDFDGTVRSKSAPAFAAYFDDFNRAAWRVYGKAAEIYACVSPYIEHVYAVDYFTRVVFVNLSEISLQGCDKRAEAYFWDNIEGEVRG